MKTGLNTILYMTRLRTIEQDFHIKPVDLAKLVSEVNHGNKHFYMEMKQKANEMEISKNSHPLRK